MTSKRKPELRPSKASVCRPPALTMSHREHVEESAAFSRTLNCRRNGLGKASDYYCRKEAAPDPLDKEPTVSSPRRAAATSQ